MEEKVMEEKVVEEQAEQEKKVNKSLRTKFNEGYAVQSDEVNGVTIISDDKTPETHVAYKPFQPRLLSISPFYQGIAVIRDQSRSIADRDTILNTYFFVTRNGHILDHVTEEAENFTPATIIEDDAEIDRVVKKSKPAMLALLIYMNPETFNELVFNKKNFPSAETLKGLADVALHSIEQSTKSLSHADHASFIMIANMFNDFTNTATKRLKKLLDKIEKYQKD